MVCSGKFPQMHCLLNDFLGKKNMLSWEFLVEDSILGNGIRGCEGDCKCEERVGIDG